MRALVFQSYRSHDVARFVERSMASVRRWASATGSDYRCLDDRFFDVLPAWYRERVGDNKLVLANLARLIVARDALAEGYDRVIWADADVLVFDPAAFRPDTTEGFAFVLETWIERRPAGFRPRRGVNNSVMVFDAGNRFLEYALWAHETLVRFRPDRVLAHGTSTALLSAINGATPLPLLTGVALLSPAMVLELAAPGEGAALATFARHHGHPVQAVNLGGSLVGKVHEGVAAGADHVDAAIDRLLATRGIALHPPDAHSGAPSAQSRGTR